MEDRQSVHSFSSFFFSKASLLTLSPRSRTCRSPADRRFVWTVGAGRGQPGSRGGGGGWGKVREC